LQQENVVAALPRLHGVIVPTLALARGAAPLHNRGCAADDTLCARSTDPRIQLDLSFGSRTARRAGAA
jgi:hypothetical protein